MADQIPSGSEQPPAAVPKPIAVPSVEPSAAASPAKKPEAGITRGQFLFVGYGALAAFGAATAAATARFFFPNVTYEPSAIFNAGPVKNFDLGVSTRWLSEDRVWVVRTEKGLYVLLAICRHLGCTPNWFQDQNRFKCPCHGSNYALNGDVIAGPAPRPLWRAKIDITTTGDLIVDKSIVQDSSPLRDSPPFFMPTT